MVLFISSFIVTSNQLIMSPLLVTTIISAIYRSPLDVVLINDAVCDYFITNPVKFLVECAFYLVVVTFIVGSINRLRQFYTTIPVRGSSMCPTMRNGDLAVVRYLDDEGVDVDVGDVIVFEYNGELYVKRIIATSVSWYISITVNYNCVYSNYNIPLYSASNLLVFISYD